MQSFARVKPLLWLWYSFDRLQRPGARVHGQTEPIHVLGVAGIEPIALGDAAVVQQGCEARIVIQPGKGAELRQERELRRGELVVVHHGHARAEPLGELERLARLRHV